MNDLKNDKHAQAQMQQWRRYLHQYPETAYEEHNTATFVAEKLLSFGLDVHTGIGQTGVVGVLNVGNSDKKIALRADMDALFIHEENQFEHKSKHDGKMHACGHDGHTAMLLGAAKYLAEHQNFNGTVYFIFQPAEEGRAGAKQMIDDGLFERFPADCVFGLHNFHDVPVGHFAIKSGAMMASFDSFEILLTGRATHAAMPHLGNDAVLASAHLITALQSIVSRNVEPHQPAVLSITQIHAGNTFNAIPETVRVCGTFRCFDKNVQTLIANKIRQVVEGVCQMFSVKADIRFNPENSAYPVTINSDAETALALEAATKVVGQENINTNPTSSMGSEDFAFMLQEKAGCYVWLGNGSSENGCLLHNPHYDFNDESLTIGAAYWVQLVLLKLSSPF